MKSARLIAVVAIAAAAACAQAGGETTGGELTPEGQLAVQRPTFTPPELDSGLDCTTTGTTWTALYTDIFGAVGKPGSCAYDQVEGGCHGGATETGAMAGAGIQCFNKDDCRLSMMKQNLVLPRNKNNPAVAQLFSYMRTHDGASGETAIMPKRPANFYYPASCIDRVKQWIANGSPND